VILPTIHLNGTSPIDLLEGWLKISHALNDALQAMYNEGPNARDYYPQGVGAFPLAQTEHCQRVLKIQQIKAEIDAIVDHVADAEGGR